MNTFPCPWKVFQYNENAPGNYKPVEILDMNNGVVLRVGHNAESLPLAYRIVEAVNSGEQGIMEALYRALHDRGMTDEAIEHVKENVDEDELWGAFIGPALDSMEDSV